MKKICGSNNEPLKIQVITDTHYYSRKVGTSGKAYEKAESKSQMVIKDSDLVIKAGFNFEKIEWKLNDHRIEVKLPETKILSSEINLDSFKLYHEDESIFRQITMDENNEALKSMQENAEKDAVANGLLDNARANAETILTGFFASAYDMDEYEIVFKDK